ncbi:transposase [Streptomyces sp. NPDC046727]|uniref:transposase n=1 Tax=Streptomyces sp. NPDC046727 TaxID=3155373 RepID=UPI0033E86BF0
MVGRYGHSLHGRGRSAALAPQGTPPVRAFSRRCPHTVGKPLTIADGGYPGTGLVMPHRRDRGQTELPAWKEDHNRTHKQVRARVEHVFARMKTWKILRDCRLNGDGVHHAMPGIARTHNLALAE